MSRDLREKLCRRADMIRRLAQTMTDARSRNVLEAAADEIEQLDEVAAQLLFAEDA